MTANDGDPSRSPANRSGSLREPKTALRAGRIYSATQNNGRITQRKNWLSGEVVTYTYDSLQRLTQATATGPSPWSESYTFDGFGNLTGKAGSNWVVNASTNRINGLSYDANGNQANGGSSAYDIDNRLLTEQWAPRRASA